MGSVDIEISPTTPDSKLSIDKIHPNEDQPRKAFDEQALDELADSIRQNGILQPILVRRQGNGYQIVAGERRYQAARRAGLKEVPVVIRKIDDDEVLRLALIENLQRADLSPIEEARGYRELIDSQGLTQEQLGKVLSKSRSTITNTLRLLDLPSHVQDLMAEGKLTAGHARAILAVAGDEGRIRLADRVVEEGLSVRQTESYAPLYSNRGDDSVPPRREPAPQSFKRAARALRLALDTNVKVKRVRNRNRIEIEFADEDELARLVQALSKAGMEGEA